MNYTTIAGHLGSDPEERFTPSGKKVISLRVACKSRKNGKDDTIWWRVTVWGDTFDNILPYFKKGSPIVVTGEVMPPDVYQDRNGQTQVSMQITAFNISFSPFGRAKGAEGQGNTSGYGGNTQGAPSASADQGFAQAPAGPAGMDIPEEEIPF